MERGFAREFRLIFHVDTIDCELYPLPSGHSVNGIVKDMRTGEPIKTRHDEDDDPCVQGDSRHDGPSDYRGRIYFGVKKIRKFRLCPLNVYHGASFTIIHSRHIISMYFLSQL